MRANEFLSTRQLKTYVAKIRIKQQGYTNIIDTTVMARTPEMARRLLRQQYGGNSVLVNTPKAIK